MVAGNNLRLAAKRSAAAVLAVCVLAFGGAQAAIAAVDLNVALFTDTPDPVPAGGTVTYGIRVENSGSDPNLSSAILTVQLPAGATFETVTPALNCSYLPGPHQVQCDFGILQGTLGVPAGTPRDVSIVVRTSTAGTINASATLTPTDGNPGNNSVTSTTTVDAGANLRFSSFAASPNPVFAAGLVTYTSIVENLGPNVASGLTIAFNVPPGLAYNSFSAAGGWNCSASGSVVTCSNAANVAIAGFAPTLTWQARVTASVVGTLTMSASISSATGDGDLSDNTTTADVQVEAGTDLSVAKSVSADPVVAASPVTFTLNVTNNGPFPASTVQVTDSIPAGFTGIAASGAGWTCGVSGNDVTCMRPTMAVGSAPIVITATAPPNASVPVGGTDATNTALVTSATPDPVSGNDQGSVTFRLQRDGADLRLNLARNPSPVPLNSDITNVLSATNLGPRVANGPLRITYQMAAGETFQSGSGTGWSCAAAGGAGSLVTCDRVAYPTGLAVNAASTSVSIITRTSVAGPVTISACTSESAGLAPIEGDIDTGNDCRSNDGSVTATTASADLVLAKSVTPGTLITSDGRLTYTLVVTNNGPDAATNVTLTDPIPMYSAASFGRPATTVGATVTTGSTGGESCAGTSTMTCALGSIASGASKTITVTVDRPMQSGTWVNTASAFSSDVGDPNRANNTGSATAIVDAVTDIELTAKSVTPDPVKSGVEATYVISIRNNGPSAAQNVSVTDTFAALGANGTFTFIAVAASNGGSCPTAPASGLAGPFDVVCNWANVPASGVRSMTVRIRPDHMTSPPSPRQIANTATVSTTTVESNSTNNSRSAVLNVVADEIDLLIDETDLGDPVAFDPGSPGTNLIVYRVVVTNRGPSFATGVAFTDTYTPPAGKTLTLLCDRPDAPSGAATTCAGAPAPICAPTGSTATPVTCTIGNLAALATSTRYLIYRVDNPPAPTGDTYNKMATVTANEAETLSANNSDPEQTTVRMLADVAVTSKTATPASVSLNQPFDWSIIARNNGPGLAANARVSDTLPAGMSLTAAPTFTLSTGGSGSCTGGPGATSFTCSFGDIAGGTTATISAPARVTTFPGSGSLSNTATIATDSIDINPGNNSGTGVVTVTRSSLACSVYRDTNDDGVRQGGETGISGVQVRLTGRDLFGNTVDITRTTDGTGNCLFDTLSPSDATGYALTETAQPTGFFDGQDKAGTAGAVLPGSKSTDVISGIPLPANTNLTGFTFGELENASIAGRVWHDRNNNGLIDGEVERIAGVTITLTGMDDQGAAVTRTALTDGSGAYSIANLRPGTYVLAETQPATWLEGRAAVGTGVTGAAGTADNVLASPTFGDRIDGIQIQAGNAGVEYNFGELRSAALAGLVWYDIDNSGAQNGTEQGIATVTVTLSGTDYRGNAVAPQVATTNGSGAYSFTNLRPGTYAVVETQPADYTDGQLQLGTVDAAPSGTTAINRFDAVTLGSQGNGVGYNFGELGRGIAGTVYNDLNDDGIQQGGEVGIPGATIRLTGCGLDRTAITEPDGTYRFVGLPDCAGGYTLTETQPAGYSDGRDTAGTSGGVVTNDQIATVILGTTTYATGYNFGEHGLVPTDIACTIPAQVARNVREPFNFIFNLTHLSGGGAPNVRLADTLPVGLELTAPPTASNGGTCTGVAGQTAFNCTLGFIAPSGSLMVTAPVRVTTYPATGTLTNGGTLTTDGNDTVLVNNACQAIVAVNEATLAGTVFADPNNDGVKQSTEQGIPGTTIRLVGTDLYGTSIDLTTTTAADGTYRFAGLAPSNGAGYTVTETQPAAFADGRDTAGSAGGTVANDQISAIVLGASVTATGYDFAEIAQGLAGSVFVDSNNNGVRDPGEPGIANVTLSVTGTDIGEAPVNATATTDADGNYLFGGLNPSNATGYLLVETQPAAWADGRDKIGTAGGTLGNDRVERLVLPAGVVSTGYDFGERGASVCGYVYNDLDNDGIKDSNETGIPVAQLALAGTDINGAAVTQTTVAAGLSAGAAVPGRYCFNDLPLPGSAGYTITETQPPDTTDGRDTAGTLGGTAGNDVISDIRFTTAGSTGDNYNFGERSTVASALSGFVWFDANHDRVRENLGRGNWTVELVRGTVGGASTTIATTTTAPDGSYRFDGLPPGGGYTVIFRNPDGNYIYGFIENIVLAPNTELTEQNQPIDPSGVVYDALTRLPVPGAVVRLTGPGGFDPAIHLVGGTTNLSQRTGTLGEYKFLLLPTAPAGTYSLDVTVPAGYLQRVSTAIPACTAALSVGPVPEPALVQSSDRAPGLEVPQHAPASCPATSGGLSAGAGTTQYYLAFLLGPTSANLINNHIPIEAVPTVGTLVVTKSAQKSEVVRGELVPYSITVRNAVDMVQTDISVVDQIPPGFQYRPGSAQIDGIRREPIQAGRQLSWGPLRFERNQTTTIKLLLTVGSGVGTGEFINQAWAANIFTGSVVSNVAKATVRIVPDPTFDCSEVIGKVFDDKNRNGRQDDSEPGIAAVRVVTVRGEQITTDQHGRYHIACADVPDEDRGSNYIVKLDPRTLPSGYRLTTENPGIVRLTRGKMSKINFGASIERVVRIDLRGEAFEAGSPVLKTVYVVGLGKVAPALEAQRGVLRIAYGRAAAESAELAKQRLAAIVARVRDDWTARGDRYRLSIETEIYPAGGGK